MLKPPRSTTEQLRARVAGLERLLYHDESPDGVVPQLERAEARIAELEAANEEVEAYAKEGWDWLNAALLAGGWKTVFDIPDWQNASEKLERERKLEEERAQDFERACDDQTERRAGPAES